MSACSRTKVRDKIADAGRMGMQEVRMQVCRWEKSICNGAAFGY